MRGGRIALVLLVLALPVALAEAVHASDPLGDETTISNLHLFDAQPRALACHDPSVDLAAVRIERGASVRVTYEFYAPLAQPLLACNGHALPASERTWNLQLGGSLEFFAVAKSADGAPAAPCLKASNGAIGNSAGCLAPVHVTTSGFWFELPLTGTFTYESGAPGAYSLTGPLAAHPSSYSRALLGVSPLQRVLYGAADWGEARLG
ncbi:MAG TPA: hypothetical protein VFH78_12075 [Candidatus Thermoplasmatota archaeon]|nr:hypothetical protein [Candidatus Thermoplasmatota archaeon]